MSQATDQVLTVAQMHAAEAALIDAGISVDALMQRAGWGAADWVWRLSGGRSVTVLCGPGNNGGDGWVIAEAIRSRGGPVKVVAAADPATPAARNARAHYRGEVLDRSAEVRGDVLVDCLFGSGLTRPLTAPDHDLLTRLARAHHHCVAVDLPSGVNADSGQPLSADLPRNDLTVALGAWKFAHFLMPSGATVGKLALVDIGVGPATGAARVLPRPALVQPSPDAHKYTRGLLAVVGGAMPGAAVLSARAAQGAGAGYVKILGQPGAAPVPSDLVLDSLPLDDALCDQRISALLIGPGLGRDATARERLDMVLGAQRPTVLDADALVLLAPRHLADHAPPTILTPHDGELFALERAFACDHGGSKPERARAVAMATGAVVVAKGADTLIAAPDGALICAPRASSWLSVAGTGDVLAGAIASRLASGEAALAAAQQGVWLHGEAARRARPPFTALELAAALPDAYAATL